MPQQPYDPGPIADDGLAEERVLAQLKLWLPRMLAEHCEARGVAMDPLPDADRGYFVSSFEQKWAEQLPPAVMVVSPGTLGDPILRGAKGRVAQWQQMNVTITVGGATEEGTRGKAHRMAAAVRRILLQQVPCEAGDAGGVRIINARPLGQRYDLRLRTRSKQRLACGVRVALLVDGVVDTRGVFPNHPNDTDFLVPSSYETEVTRAITPIADPASDE